MRKRCGGEQRRRNRKHIILLLILSLFLAVLLSGCLGSEKPTDPEELYWWHIDESNKLSKIARRFYNESFKTDDPLEQNRLLKETKKNWEGALEEDKNALNLLSDPDKKLYIEYRIKTRMYSINAVDNLIFITETDSKEDAEEAAAEFGNNVDQALEWGKKAAAIIPRRD